MEEVVRKVYSVFTKLAHFRPEATLFINRQHLNLTHTLLCPVRHRCVAAVLLGEGNAYYFFFLRQRCGEMDMMQFSKKEMVMMLFDI